MIDVQMNKQSAKLLQDAMRAVDKKTDWHIEKQSNKAMWHICRSAGAAMKPKSMARRREVIKNPDRTGRGKSARGAKFLIKVLHQDKQPTLLHTNSRTDKRSKIAKLGLAGTVFKIAAGRFGKQLKGVKTRGGKKFVRTVKQHAKGKSHVAVAVELTYLFDAFPGIVDRAVKKGMTAFIHGFDRDWASALKKEGLA